MHTYHSVWVWGSHFSERNVGLYRYMSRFRNPRSYWQKPAEILKYFIQVFCTKQRQRIHRTKRILRDYYWWGQQRSTLEFAIKLTLANIRETNNLRTPHETLTWKAWLTFLRVYSATLASAISISSYICA